MKVVRNRISYKTVGKRMGLSPPRVEQGLQRSVCLKSYNVQKWEIKFTLGLDAAKSMRYIKKRFK